MTIQEAIKSGKPFRRKEYDYYLLVFQNHFFYEILPMEGIEYQIDGRIFEPVRLAVSAILADDWEIKK